MYVPPLGYKREGTHGRGQVWKNTQRYKRRRQTYLDSQAIQLTVDVGYYAPVDWTNLTPVSDPVFILLASNPIPSPLFWDRHLACQVGAGHLAWTLADDIPLIRRRARPRLICKHLAKDGEVTPQDAHCRSQAAPQQACQHHQAEGGGNLKHDT
jgi:hypothetical protein